MKVCVITDLFKTTWDELRDGEMIKIIEFSDMLTHADPGTLEHGALVIEVLKTLRKNKGLVAKLNLAQAVDCFDDITFFHRDQAGSFRMPWYFFPVGDFFIPTFWTSSSGLGVDFHRPDLIGGLPMYNRSFDQLVYADAAFSNFCLASFHYKQSPSKALEAEMESNINELIAILYQKAEEFDACTIEKRASLIPEKLDPPRRALILHTYANVRSFLMNRCPNLFPKETAGGDDTEKIQEIEPIQTGPMWMNLRYDLAETAAFKGLSTARNALIYDALDYLEKKAVEVNDQKLKRNAQG